MTITIIIINQREYYIIMYYFMLYAALPSAFKPANGLTGVKSLMTRKVRVFVST